MSEQLLSKVDTYFRRDDTWLAKSLRKISPETGLAYRTSRKKIVFERSVAGCAAVVTAPLVAGLAIAVKSEDRGKVFYKSPRVGMHGELFELVKIRSLYEGADNDAAENLKRVHTLTTGDPRSTKIGSWMRKYRFDELPQLWQIARGKMALFGIRAITELSWQELKNVRGDDAGQLYNEYIAALPGAINPVSAFSRENGNLHDNYHLNSFYARQASLGLDLYMAFHTFVRSKKK